MLDGLYRPSYRCFKTKMSRPSHLRKQSLRDLPGSMSKPWISGMGVDRTRIEQHLQHAGHPHLPIRIEIAKVVYSSVLLDFGFSVLNLERVNRTRHTGSRTVGDQHNQFRRPAAELGEQ